MTKRLIALMLAQLVFFVAGVLAEGGPASFEADLDGDSIVERIDIQGVGENALRVFHGETLLWESVPVGWKPWKLVIEDVDGDGTKEMVVGVFKSTKFFPKPHNCLFIYGWDGKRGFPKWLGSSLGRPFTDFVFVDLGQHKGNELVALEKTLDGRQGLSVYHWNSFGFTRFLEFGPWNEAAIREVAGTELRILANGEEQKIDLEKNWRKENEEK